MSGLCKVTAIIVFVLDFIGAIIIGNQFGDHDEFNWLMFLYCVLTAFFFWLLFYSIGEILERLEEMNKYSYRIYKQLNRKVTDEGKNQEVNSMHNAHLTSTVKKTDNGRWICKKCHTANDVYSMICKDCGNYR